MLNIPKKKHVKWAMMKSNNPKDVAATLHYSMGINDIEIFESTINDKEGNKVEDIWVLEFDAAPYKVETLKKLGNLKEIGEYLM